jgi:hypothetical protein
MSFDPIPWRMIEKQQLTLKREKNCISIVHTQSSMSARKMLNKNPKHARLR